MASFLCQVSGARYMSAAAFITTQLHQILLACEKHSQGLKAFLRIKGASDRGPFSYCTGREILKDHMGALTSFSSWTSNQLYFTFVLTNVLKAFFFYIFRCIFSTAQLLLVIYLHILQKVADSWNVLMFMLMLMTLNIKSGLIFVSVTLLCCNAG